MKIATKLHGRDKLVAVEHGVLVDTEDENEPLRSQRIMVRYRSWKSAARKRPPVTKKTLFRAFGTPERSRQEVKVIVDRYVGDSPVPPTWGRRGVRGTFGRKIERLWARHIRGLRQATYRDKDSGRFLTPVVQSAYDFGTTPEKLREMAANSQPPPTTQDKKPAYICLDEGSSYFSGLMPGHTA